MESLLMLQFILLFVPISSYENLSRRNTTLITQSSTFGLRNATFANDGVYATTEFKCAHTAVNRTKAWLQADLGTPFRIRSVVIYYRKEGNSTTDWKQYRFRQFYLDVSDLPATQTTTAQRTRCYTDNTTAPNLPPNIISIPCKQPARYVIVETTYDAPEDNPYKGAMLEICEIEINGCDATHYGTDCSYECSENCIEQTCNTITGICTNGCKTGYYGDFCNKVCGGCLERCHRHTGECEGACPVGNFGAHCERTCSQTCEGGCLKTSGVCTSCMDGWYGDTCEEICGAGCSLRCDQVDGNCTCKRGWEGYDCRECSLYFYGESCKEPCSTNCVQGICFGNNGSCIKGRSLKNSKMEFTQYLAYVFAGLFSISLSLNIFLTLRAKRCKQETEESKNMEENQYQQIEMADLNPVAVETAEGEPAYENIRETNAVCEMPHYETLKYSA